MRIGPSTTTGSATFPATSAQTPVTPAVAPAASMVTGADRVATPDWFGPSSVQSKVTTTG